MGGTVGEWGGSAPSQEPQPGFLETERASSVRKRLGRKRRSRDTQNIPNREIALGKI